MIDTKCRVDARGANAQTVGGKADEVSRWLILMPISAAPTEFDEITASGTTYKLIGKPWLVKDAAGRPHHYECSAIEG